MGKARNSTETCRLRLLPVTTQERVLRAMLRTHEDLLAWLETSVPADQPLNHVELHNGWYERARRKSGLPARSVTLALKDFAQRRQGRPVIGLPLDDRLYSIKNVHTLSILTPEGRQMVPYRVMAYEPAAYFEHGGASARLISQDEQIDLVATSPETPSNLKEGIMTTTDTVVSRIGRVIAGMTHAAISAAEQANPTAVIEQSIREIESAADEVKGELGKVMAEKHRITARKGELEREYEDLDAKLRAAVEAGRDELASAGLGRQIDIEAQIVVLDRLLDEAEDRIAKLDEALSAVRASRREAEERLGEFTASRNGGGGPTQNGASGNAADKALGKVERAQNVAARIAGVPGGAERTDAASLEELNRLARERAIAERLRKLKGRNDA